ncbi:MAG: beta-galactosidase [Chitinophagaceae bacterium]|nr:beta-galactosidase [Chitinophagaceae bacterium]
MRAFLLFSLFTLSTSSCKKSNSGTGGVTPAIIPRPGGIFSSAGSTSSVVLNHAETRGILVRAFWKDIEPAEGNFNFTSLDNQINSIKAAGKKYSLGILAGGIGSPDWLITQKGAPYFNYLFRGQPYKLPLIWDNISLTYLGKLADKLAEKYGNDQSLMLVYIPQMTANGVEGHLNGFNQSAFAAAGYTEMKWIDASLQNARRFANAFKTKALAFEVHDLFGSSNPASSIINTLWNDASLNKRMGAAMWWISGNETYQPGLITVLQNFPGDIYCQVIDRSDSTASFPSGDYTKVFEQAKRLRARYIEPWDHEFSISTWNTLFHDFNVYADTLRKY